MNSRQNFCPVMDVNQLAIDRFVSKHPNLISEISRFRPRLIDELKQEYGETIARKILDKAFSKTLGKAIDIATKPFGLAGKQYKEYLAMGQSILKEGALSGIEAKGVAEQLATFSLFLKMMGELRKNLDSSGSGRPYSLTELYVTCANHKEGALRDAELRRSLKEQEGLVRDSIVPVLDRFVNEAQVVIIPHFTRMFKKLMLKFENQFPKQKEGSLKELSLEGMKLVAWRQITGPMNEFNVRYSLESLSGDLRAIFEQRNNWAKMFFGQIAPREFNSKPAQGLFEAYKLCYEAIDEAMGSNGEFSY